MGSKLDGDRRKSVAMEVGGLPLGWKKYVGQERWEEPDMVSAWSGMGLVRHSEKSNSK